MTKRPPIDEWDVPAPPARRPPVCDGCVCNPKTEGYMEGLVGEFVPPFGPVDAELLVVGISPAEVEEQTGVPLTGPSGKKLHQALDWALDSRTLKVRKMNAVNCRTLKKGLSQDTVNRDPTAREFRDCASRWLLPELAKTQAKAILVLGQLPFDLLLKPRAVALWRLPKVGHRFTFAMAMGHRTVLPRSLFDTTEERL